MASTQLSKTLSTPTDGKKWTWSAWVKRSKVGGDQALFNAGGSGSPNVTIRFGYSSDNKIYVFYLSGGSMVWEFATNAEFRDTNGWYHIVVSYDSTQSTATDRLKLYVNSTQQTFSNSTNSSQNITTTMNSAVAHYIGNNNGGNYFDGSMSHIHFIDGTAYDATAFGQYDANGVWKIKTSPSVTNGFFILKDGNSVTDQSGNGNNFTVAGGTLTNTEDSPSNVFATLNPLSKSNATLSNGNTTGALTTNTDRFIPASTLKVSQGKWYAEFKLNSLTDHTGVGITGDEGKASNNNNAIGKETNSYAYVSTDGNFYDADSGSAYGSTYTSNDIIGIALDLDNNYIYFSKNGTWQNSGDPTSGATGTGGKAITDPASVPDRVYAMGVGSHSTGGVCNWSANFGNGYFGTTAVASAGTNASGNGIFEYDVPTGYTALSTKGLNL